MNKKITWISIGGIILLLAFLWKKRIPPEKARLTVDTTPFKGEVFVDGISWGIAPQTKDLDIGAHTVSFGNIKGCETPSPQTITLIEGETREVIGEYIILKFIENGDFSSDEYWAVGNQWSIADGKAALLQDGSTDGWTLQQPGPFIPGHRYQITFTQSDSSFTDDNGLAVNIFGAWVARISSDGVHTYEIVAGSKVSEGFIFGMTHHWYPGDTAKIDDVSIVDIT